MFEPQTIQIGEEAMAIGPATRLFYAKSDVLGRLSYQVEERPIRQVHFGNDQTDAQWAVFDQILSAAFFHPPSTRLIALGSYISKTPQIMLMGNQWGQIIDGDGEVRTVDDPLAEFQRLRIPLCIGEQPNHIGIRFCMNIHFRDAYAPNVLRLLKPKKTHTLEIFFDTPSGDFVEAILVCQDRQRQTIVRTTHLYDFPLRWADYQHSEPITPQPEEDLKKSTTRISTTKPKPPKPRTIYKPPPDTLIMNDADAIKAMIDEKNLDTRWTMIEKNIENNSPARTYQMLCHFGELIGERLALWDSERLVNCLATQPAALLVAIMSNWSLPTVIALADQSPEKEYITQWLREREVERLMEMNPKRSVTTRKEAAHWLGLALSSSGPDNKTIRRTWRRLLGFMNSDYGRGTEQAIHRKKDEIAKRLQQARDALSRPD